MSGKAVQELALKCIVTGCRATCLYLLLAGACSGLKQRYMVGNLPQYGQVAEVQIFHFYPV